MARAQQSATPEKQWHVYVLECSDGSFYTGIATDVEARYRTHAAGKGARYTKAHPPRALLGSAVMPDLPSACKAEWAIKQLPRGAKLALLRELQIR